MALTQKERDNLAPHLFAVPGKRALPMPDAAHTKMAWSMVDYTKGLSDTEKAEAKRNILRRANELGINTSGWHAHDSARLDMQPAGDHDGHQMQAMRFEAMAMEVPDVPGHPNRVPFSGVMTRVDQASENPVGGAQGKRVLIPKGVAESALGSLLGMGVNYTASMDGHDAQKKIGVITAATIEGDAIHIEGFLYGSDFPAVIADIQARKSLLGFSYEAQAAVADWNSDPVEVTNCVFTGAAILLKDKAAYTTTSLTAHADSELTDMDMEQIMAAVAKLTEQNTALMAEVTALKANSDKLQASSVLHKVKPHTDALRAAADGMEKDGMGMHDKRGHVAHLRRMADTMDAEAVMGKVPHIYNDHNWMEASASPEVEALKAEVVKVSEELKAAKFAAAAEPARKTETGADSKPALQASGAKPDFAKLDAEMKAKGATTQQRLTAITAARMGLN
ncbi:MAG: DUF6582 domain-containing protein [Thiobacillus sp.]